MAHKKSGGSTSSGRDTEGKVSFKKSGDKTIVSVVTE